MPAKLDKIPPLVVFLLLCLSCRISAQDAQIRIKSYQAHEIKDEKIKKNKILLIPADSTTSGIANFKTSRSMNQGDLIQFSIRSGRNFVYLFGIDAKNNYRQYDQPGVLNSEKEFPGAFKGLQLEDKGLEHFILIFSASVLDTNFLHFFGGIEMTMDEVFARRVKKQIGGKLIDPSFYSIHSGTDGISITLTDAGNKELENKILPIVIDARVTSALSLKTDSSDYFYHLGLQKMIRENNAVALRYFDSAILYNAFRPEIYFARACAGNDNKPSSAALSDYNTALAMTPEKDSLYDFYKAEKEFYELNSNGKPGYNPEAFESCMKSFENAGHHAGENASENTGHHPGGQNIGGQNDKKAWCLYRQALLNWDFKRQFDKALPLITEALRREPDNIKYLQARADIFFEYLEENHCSHDGAANDSFNKPAGDTLYKGVVRDYERVLKMIPEADAKGIVSLRKSIAAIRIGMEENTEPDKNAWKGKLDSETLAGYYIVAGEYQRSKKNIPAATRDYNEALKYDRNNAGLIRKREVFFEEQKKFREAIAEADRLIRLEPRNADYYFERGVLKIKSGMVTQGNEDFTIAYSINPL